MQQLTPEPGGGANARTVLFKMIRQEGLRRSFRGVSVMVAGAGPAHALYFSCYELIKNHMVIKTNSQVNYLVYGAAGAVSTLLHDGIMNPAEGNYDFFFFLCSIYFYLFPHENFIICINFCSCKTTITNV